MKTDLYTKIVLTVIALALIVIIGRDINFTSHAYAQNKTSFPKVMDVNIVSINGFRPFDSQGKLQISVPYEGLKVNVQNRVNLNVPFGGIDVNVQNYRDFK